MISDDGKAPTAYGRLSDLYLEQVLSGEARRQAYEGARAAYAQVTGRTEDEIDRQLLAEFGPIDPVSRPPDSIGIWTDRA